MAPISLITFLLLHVITATISVTAQYNATDNFLLNCGSTSNAIDNGRRWDPDTHYPNSLPSNFSDISTEAEASDQPSSVTEVPYKTARVMKSQFTYSFPVSPGPKFLRLYFYPSNYSGFSRSESFFTVTANNFTLLSNFSAFLTVSATPDLYIRKEYVVNVDETQRLNITFTPSQGSYAFVNGIEIVSMPTDLYIRETNPITFVGQSNFFFIENSTAFETLYRFNVGGNQLSSTDDTGMYRVWAGGDEEFFRGVGYQTPHLDVPINYTSETPAYTAPEIVYTTSRTIANHSKSLTWSFPLDSGFNYLFRLHFCEFQQEVTKEHYRVFDISIGKQMAMPEYDVIHESGGWRRPVYKDFVVSVRAVDGKRSKQDVPLDLHPSIMRHQAVYDNAILNGLEIFKLSDANGNLSVPNPELNLVPPGVPPSNDKTKKSSRMIIVYIIAGVIGGIAVLSIPGFWIFRRRGRNSSTSDTKSLVSESTEKKGGSRLSSLPSNLCRHFLLKEIEIATSNFDDKLVIGRGGFGNVYKGYLDSSTAMVAVKRLNPQSKQGIREFQTEIEMLSKLRHLHLVSLIGYCDDNGEMILVYDYMAHGTLRDHLYKTNNAPIPWTKRLEICIGAAKGLHYLHTGTKHTIIHRDVKSTNILLDDTWIAKVSDFGLSKVGPLGGMDNTPVSTAVKGSIGYLDPEYFKRQQLTEKSDVYSFGVVLFEVLCARQPIGQSLPKEQVNLAAWACRCCKKGNLDRIVDPSLEGQIAPECLSKFGEIAYNCLKGEGIQRPSMGDVVGTLEFALQLQEDADKGGDKMKGYNYPISPFITNDHTNISTDEDEAFSRSGVNSKSSGTSMTSYSDDKMNSNAVFSEIKCPLAR